MVGVTAVSQCDLQDKNFPTTAQPTVPVSISFSTHQNGDYGNIGWYIRNETGNPGDVTVSIVGLSPFVVHPGDSLGTVFNPALTYCQKFTFTGTLTFAVAGTYHMVLYGVHTGPVVDDTATWDTVVGAVGVPKGQLQSYEFPHDIGVNTPIEFNLPVKNIGTATGIICAVITNKASNTGKIIITTGGSDYTLDPGLSLIASQVRNIGEVLLLSGQIKFDTVGGYLVDLCAGHKDVEGGTVIIDQTVTVDG